MTVELVVVKEEMSIELVETSVELLVESTEVIEVIEQGPQGPQGDSTAGGTVGQVLTKSSSEDYDAEWADVNALPDGGVEGQVLTIVNGGDVEYRSIDSNNVLDSLVITHVFDGTTSNVDIHHNRGRIVKPTMLNEAGVEIYPLYTHSSDKMMLNVYSTLPMVGVLTIL